MDGLAAKSMVTTVDGLQAKLVDATLSCSSLELVI